MDFPYINIHTHHPTGEGIEMVADPRPLRSSWAWREPPVRDSLYSVGIHPWQLGGLSETDITLALRRMEDDRVSAIGEIGLDFAPSVIADHSLQKMVFAASLRIAEERGLPVILHCVKAFEPTMEVLSGFTLRAVIFHGFVGSPEQARRAVNSGYRLSLGERSFSSPKTIEAMRGIPLEKMFLETDDSPITIDEIYGRAAEILNLSLPQLKAQLYNNYITIFGQ